MGMQSVDGAPTCRQSKHLVASTPVVLHVVGTVGLHGISLETLTSMVWNIPRSSSRSSVPLALKIEKCLAGRGEFLSL